MVAAGAVRSEVVVLAVGDVVGVEEALIASGNGQDSTVPELRIKRSKIAFFFLFVVCNIQNNKDLHKQVKADV